MPDRLCIEKADRLLYDSLDKEPMLKFRDSGGRRTRREQFLFAMALGFKAQSTASLRSRNGFVLEKDLHPEDEALISAVALASGTVEVLAKKDEVFRIAEEYAKAGIRLLEEAVRKPVFEKWLERELLYMYDNFGIGNTNNA